MLIYTQREREHERNSVPAENRVDCLQSQLLGGVCNGFCVQPISALNLGYVTTYTTPLHCDTYNETLYCNVMQRSYIM